MIRRRFAPIVAACLALGSAAATARAGFTIAGPEQYKPAAIPATFTPGASAESILNGGSPTYAMAGPTGADLVIMQRDFPGWTFAGGGNLNGILRISLFEAYASAQIGGADIEIGYTRAATDAPLGSLEWIQVVNYVDAQGNMSLKLDNQPSPNYTGPPVPFYWDPDEDKTKKAFDTYGFSDHPGRDWPPVPVWPNMSHLSWWADLYLAVYDGAKGVKIVGGLQWGFQDWVFSSMPPPGGGAPPPPPPPPGPAVVGTMAVPEPGGLALLSSGAAAGLWRLLRGRRRLLGVLAAAAGVMGGLAVLLAPARPSPADRSFPPGPPVFGVPRLELRTPGPVVLGAASVPIEVDLVNDSSRPIVIWSTWAPLNHRVEVEDSRGHAPPETETGAEWRKAFSPNGARDKNYPVRIPARGEVRPHARFDLAKLYRLGPGEYRVRVTYEDGRDETYLRLASDWVPFWVIR